MSSGLKDCVSLGNIDFFKVIRRSVPSEDIKKALEKEAEKYTRFVAQPSVRTFFEILQSIVLVVDRISKGESMAEQVSQLKDKISSVVDKTELGQFADYFSVGMTIDTLSKSGYLFDKLSYGNKELASAKLGDMIRAKINRLIDGLTPRSASTDKFAELLGGNNFAEFLQVKETAKLVSRKTHDSAANFKFSMDQTYKVR